MLPSAKPENTEDREGFIHLYKLNGEVLKAESDYILRSFSMDELESYKNTFKEIENVLNNKYGTNTVQVEIKDSYKNMKDIIDKEPHSVDLVHETYKELGIMIVDTPIRGGTDGAALSYMGLPCPNLGDGGENFHGVFEYLDVDQMKEMTRILITMMDKLE